MKWPTNSDTSTIKAASTCRMRGMTSRGDGRRARCGLLAVTLGALLLTTGCTQPATMVMKNRAAAGAVPLPNHPARDVYAEAGVGGLRPLAAAALARVYVPNSGS